MDQVTFADVLQKSFIAMSMGGTDRITTLNILLNVSMSFLVGMFIFYMYKKTYQGVLYQRSFNISLVLASTVTALVIMTISGNLILSLGMVGALSIVRFRTPVKDSMDLVFLFWAISTGIANGVGYYNISIIGSVMIAVFLLLLTNSGKAPSDAFLLILQLTDPSSEDEILDEIRSHVDRIAIKSKSISDGNVEITMELKVPGDKSVFVNELQEQGKVKRATLVSYDQDLSAV
ncbi:MAG: DUF4956 domain-containing protein [Candidatus Thiodiazotropha sp. (ex Codakia rugifera)]|nr:DUF4956 domain-containing protein [Candidatus Thiodiazotropha sp. (ex Codakia rugifera)]